ncbi:MAG: prepilin-type N-terminal cleavage/methylation domain-containing protein [Anaerostipes sp.]|nr:prepilin-type N-terminal cleavage/methylation domain-containing protein [Anaerostipes sp.]
MKNQKGMTMVEVMVAFVILLLGIAFLYRSTLFSLNQAKMAQEIQKHSDDSYADYYNKAGSSSTEKTTEISISAKDGNTNITWQMPIKFGTAVSSESKGGIHIYFFQLPGGES